VKRPEDGMGYRERVALVDTYRSVDLDDVGGQGLTVVVAVSSDGCEHLGVVERQQLGAEGAGFTRNVPEHESFGPLPIDVVKRIAVAGRTYRCGRPTRTGRPCRNRVSHPGDSCHHHCERNPYE
jgi:hypothetical protein